jgi:dihydrofolate reductase
VRKIVVYELLSLDGVAEDPDGFFADWDDAMDANLAAVIATQDAVILGRRSYTEWAQFWPSSQIQPFATFINGVTKYVATSTPLDRDWANATVLELSPTGGRFRPRRSRFNGAARPVRR